MAVKLPNTDRPSGLSGGSDTWDNGLAGVLLSADYFAESASPSTSELQPPLFTNAGAFYAATVSQGGETQNLTASRLNNSNAIYAAAVVKGVVNLSPSLLNNSQSFYASAIVRGTVNLSAGLYSSSQSFYTPTVSRGVVNLSTARFDNSALFYGATATQGASNISPLVFTNAATFFPLSVRYSVTAPSILSSNLIYAATVTRSPLVSSRLDNSATFYTHNAASLFNAYAPLVASVSAVFTPSILWQNNVLPGIVSNVNDFFGADVSLRTQYLLASRFDNQSLNFDAYIIQFFIDPRYSQARINPNYAGIDINDDYGTIGLDSSYTTKQIEPGYNTWQLN